MDEFDAIYKILTFLRSAMDFREFDETALSSDNIEIESKRLKTILIMLQENGFINGLTVYKTGKIKTSNAKITLKGLEYLYENRIMREISKSAAS